MPNNNPQQTSQSQQQQKSAENPGKLADRIEKGAEQTTHSAIQRVREVREQATSGLEHQRAEIAQRIRRLGGVMRSGSETLSTDDPYAQHLLSSTGDRVEQLANYVENLTPGQLAEDVQTFARQRPAMFFGGAFLLGLGLGRFVKSSASAASGSGGGGQRSYVGSNDSDDDSDGESGYAESDIEQSFAGDASASQRRRTTANPGSSAVSYGSSGASSTTLPYGVGSSNSSTVTSAASYGPSSGAQSGTPSGTPGGSTTSTSPNSAATGTAARETDRGQGTKS